MRTRLLGLIPSPVDYFVKEHKLAATSLIFKLVATDLSLRFMESNHPDFTRPLSHDPGRPWHWF